MQNDDLIWRSDALAMFPCSGDERWMIGDVINIGSVRMRLERVPAVEAAPVVHGQNVTPTHYSDMFICSECGFVCEITKLVYGDEDHPEVGMPNAYEYDCKFCPDCGAKMDLEVTWDD